MTDFSQNPLYHPPAAPDFARIQPGHIDAIFAIIKENRAETERLATLTAPTWDTLMQPLERMANRLAKAVSPISHLHGVQSSDEWRAAYEKILPELAAYGADLAQHNGLYQAVRALQAGDEYPRLSAAQQKVINDSLESFERHGVALPDDAKAEFRANSQRLTELASRFSNNVLDATNAWQLPLADDARLSGLPEAIKPLLADLARQRGMDGYCLTLDAPVVIPVLTYADDRELRETVYRAYNARASELADDGQYDNAAIIEETMRLRARQAEILGYADYAALSVADKMAKQPQAVFAFLDDLIDKSKAAGEAEMAALRDYAARELSLADLAPWDVAYAAEKLRQAQYALSQEDLRPYFPISTVIDGLFAISQRLFGVHFRANHSLSTWHKDVLAYDVLNADGSLRAQFYLDPYARAKKRGGAWMDGAVSRFRDNGALQLPVAYLVCNSTPPVGDSEACLTHQEVTTLFHEFGHGLHHMLTDVDIYSISGINGVEWDAVEQPSQFMENYCYDREALAGMTRHKDSGAPLPDELYNKLIAAKNFQSAMAMLRQLEFALFDFRYHSGTAWRDKTLDVHAAVRAAVAVTPAYAANRFPMQFSHIFAGGYAAGYYSYKWAEVLSADSFAAFEEEGVFNAATGARFRDEILATGGSRPSMASFIAFRGREPRVDALLQQSGIR
ncbi:M3 family metallopeptidase [Cardiobacterium sp. Marseille-Q4385]|uniref:M3 family metallopeptidase n=1 Tax=Cardiobacterium sp. Marseille-Q4385 TaxID=2866573 RepID=UPI001CE3D689|nr:M3 family metallopeptidase [Cardiobacterium sp. Marseille-Q4385]